MRERKRERERHTERERERERERNRFSAGNKSCVKVKFKIARIFTS